MIDIKKLLIEGGWGLCFPFRKMRKSQEAILKSNSTQFS